MTGFADPTKTKTLRCAIYARFSTDNQDGENSLDRQLRACQAWAERHGHTMVPGHVYQDEAKSGASTIARAALQRMLAVLRAPGRLPFDAVLVDDASRLDRGGHMAQLVDTFRARSVRLISVDSKAGRDLTDEDEDLRTDIETVFNRQQLREIARRTRNGLASKVRNGWHAGGRVYGYRLVGVWPDGLPTDQRSGDNRTGTLVEIHDKQAATVCRIFGWYAAGLGFRAIAQRLTAAGIPSPGADWKRTVRLAAPSWDIGCLRAILVNPKYRGEWTWNSARWVKRPESQMTDVERGRARDTGRHPRRRVANDQGEWITQQRDDLRIIPEELWQVVAARFEGRVRPTRGATGHRRSASPFLGLLTCSCGSPMRVTYSGGKGHVYSYVGCARHATRGDCSNAWRARGDAVTDRMLGFVLAELLDPARVRRAVEIVNRKLGNGRATRDDRRSKLETEIRTLEGEARRLVDLIAGGASLDTLGEGLRAREARLSAARAELEALADAPQVGPQRWTSADVVARLGRLREDLEGADPQLARAALQRIFVGVTVRPVGKAALKGWSLECRHRDWTAFLPQSSVAGSVSSGGALHTDRATHVSYVELARAS